MDNSKYYFVKPKSDQAYPLVDILEEDDDLWELELSSPVPRKPVMADFLSGAKDVFDKRIADVMQSMNMEGVQFFPAEIDDTKGNIHDNYVCVIVDDNTYELADKERSVSTSDGKKMIIDREKLSEIPLNKRLGMRLREAPGYYLYHQSVVDAIMALEPTGMYFQDIEDYEIL